MPEALTTPSQPDLRDLIQLEIPVDVRVAPGGQRLAILVRRANWNDNSFETLVQVYERSSDKCRWLTRSGNVNQVEWLDSESLAVLRPGSGVDGKAQVWVYESCVGDGWQVTQHKTGVDRFYPFAGGIVFKGKNPEREEKNERSEKFGKFTHFEQETSADSLYYVDLKAMQHYQSEVRLCTADTAKDLVLPVVELSRLLPQPLGIENVVISPQGDMLYLNCRTRDDLVYWRDTSVFCLQLDAAQVIREYLEREKSKAEAKAKPPSKEAGKETPPEEKEDLSYLGKLTRLPLPPLGRVVEVSPDGRTLAVLYPSRDNKMYTQAELWSIPTAKCFTAADEQSCQAELHRLAGDLDQEIFDVFWTEIGIFISYPQGVHFHLGHINAQSTFSPIDLNGLFLEQNLHVCRTGQIVAVLGNAQSFPEAYFLEPAQDPKDWTPKRLTNFGIALGDWQLGKVETIRWTSKDGTEIEGVLRKPDSFDPSKKYPLVFVVHGGPSWISSESLLSYEDLFNYPTIQLVNQDVLVLKPNYRGSIGRGQAFKELNVNNLGVGDLWDLESAIDHLAALGFVDVEKVGCMGWSQGGYISAFAGLHSRRFTAVSVGAGISDWYTYHISNDIPDFTTDYLSASPFRERSIYEKTAPISNLANAKTPTLIQHGSDDRRVPLSNAMELYRGLKEMGVPVELFVYPGMGHPITKPRENHAVMAQNLIWFEHYLLGKELKLPE
jgi:dipeptidyl aminopeptidase/acylaminoacyl peptidase